MMLGTGGAFAQELDDSAFDIAVPVNDVSEDSAEGQSDIVTQRLGLNREIAPKRPCDPNPCSGETPLCTPLSKGAKASGIEICGCNPANDTCSAGRKCSVRCSGYTMTCSNEPGLMDIYWACAPCPRGEKCKCGVGEVSDGNGNCIIDDKCSPNPCTGATPVCSLDPSNEKGYVCGCNDSSCYPGYECSRPAGNVYTCAVCPAGKKCGCPEGQAADGRSGCKPKPSCAQMICPEGTSCVESETKLCCTVNDIPCSEGCEECDRLRGMCKKCERGRYESGGKCPLCPENCTVCDSVSACTACSDGYRLVDGKCVESTSCEGVKCPAGQTCKQGVCSILCFPSNCTAPFYCNPKTHDCTGGRCGCLKGTNQCVKC